MVTDLQLKANTENAKLGGVKTLEGIATSKYNAQTHGILRNSLTEYEKEFYRDILRDLEDQHNQQGTVEQIILERIALNYLKLYRIQKAETEYIQSRLDPTIVKSILDSFSLEETVTRGYTPKIASDAVEKLSNIYARYETTIENRLFRALHELERVQRLRKGERLQQPVAVDISQMGSFGENQK